MPPLPTTWDPSNKGADSTLSNGNKTVDLLQLFTGVLGTIGRNAGDANGWYVEYTFAATGPFADGFTSLNFGIANISWSTAEENTGSPTRRLGQDAAGNSCGITTNTNSYLATSRADSPGPSTAGLPTGGFGSQAIGQTIGLLLKAGNITLYGTGGSAGTVIPWTTSLTGLWYPAAGAMHHDPRSQQVIINGGDSPWIGTLPAGAQPWNGAASTGTMFPAALP